MDTGSPFGGFGSSREMTIHALVEASLLFSLFAVAIIARTSNVSEIARIISGTSFLTVFAPLLLAFIGFLIVLLAEGARYPFDNPATHLELTMVHEAMILEYSGKRLALIEWTAMNKLLLFLTLAVNLFFPWGIALSLGGDVIFGFIFYVLKIAVLTLFIGILESSIAKLRFFRIPDLLSVSLFLGIVSIIISFLNK